MAKKANEKSAVKLPILLDTLAEAYYANGEKAKAVEIMEQVLELTDSAVFKKNYLRFKGN